MLSATKQAISIKLATMVGHLLCDLDLAHVYMACPPFSSYICVYCVFEYKYVCISIGISIMVTENVGMIFVSLVSVFFVCVGEAHRTFVIDFVPYNL